LELLREAKERKPEYSLRFLITVSGVGLACLLGKNKRKLQKVEAILVLTSLGKGELFTLQVSTLKNPLVGKVLDTLKSLKKPYQLLTESLYNPLPFG
jgi:aminopeptidase-like protein